MRLINIEVVAMKPIYFLTSTWVDMGLYLIRNIADKHPIMEWYIIVKWFNAIAAIVPWKWLSSEMPPMHLV